MELATLQGCEKNYGKRGFLNGELERTGKVVEDDVKRTCSNWIQDAQNRLEWKIKGRPMFKNRYKGFYDDDDE